MDLPKVLEDLYAEKRWIQDLITALEIATRSPQQRFAAKLVETMREGYSARSILKLQAKRRDELDRLAGAVRRNAAKSVKHPSRNPANGTAVNGAGNDHPAGVLRSIDERKGYMAT